MMIEYRYAAMDATPGGRRVAGIAMRYGERTTIEGKFVEEFRPGAFAPIGDVILNWQHDRNKPLARTGEHGGLQLADSATELRVAATLPETSLADDAVELIRRGVFRGLSIEFRSVEEKMVAGVRVIQKALLSGIAVVDRPAYSQAELQARMAMEPRPRRVRMML